MAFDTETQGGSLAGPIGDEIAVKVSVLALQLKGDSKNSKWLLKNLKKYFFNFENVILCDFCVQ